MYFPDSVRCSRFILDINLSKSSFAAKCLTIFLPIRPWDVFKTQYPLTILFVPLLVILPLFLPINLLLSSSLDIFFWFLKLFEISTFAVRFNSGSYSLTPLKDSFLKRWIKMSLFCNLTETVYRPIGKSLIGTFTKLELYLNSLLNSELRISTL